MNYIVSKRTDGKIQIVLSDDDGVQSSKVTAEVFADLNSGMYTAQNLLLKSTITHVSIELNLLLMLNLELKSYC